LTDIDKGVCIGTAIYDIAKGNSFNTYLNCVRTITACNGIISCATIEDISTIKSVNTIVTIAANESIIEDCTS
jgi:hypothetical protein